MVHLFSLIYNYVYEENYYTKNAINICPSRFDISLWGKRKSLVSPTHSWEDRLMSSPVVMHFCHDFFLDARSVSVRQKFLVEFLARKSLPRLGYTLNARTNRQRRLSRKYATRDKSSFPPLPLERTPRRVVAQHRRGQWCHQVSETSLSFAAGLISR